jgi:uncharacterized protein involved in oxidation of intracellular sulfur
MKIGMVVSSSNPEILWNAFRLANFCLNEMDDVTIFLNGPAVKFAAWDDPPQFHLNELAKTFTLSEGILLA